MYTCVDCGHEQEESGNCPECPKVQLVFLCEGCGHNEDDCSCL